MQQHLHSGAKKVIISAPSDGADITVVFGVNQNNITQNHTLFQRLHVQQIVWLH